MPILLSQTDRAELLAFFPHTNDQDALALEFIDCLGEICIELRFERLQPDTTSLRKLEMRMSKSVANLLLGLNDNPLAYWLVTTTEDRRKLRQGSQESVDALHRCERLEELKYLLAELQHNLKEHQNKQWHQATKFSMRRHWFQLFKLWERFGNDLTFSFDRAKAAPGKLMRYLALAHRIMNEKSPRPGTVKEAYENWKEIHGRNAKART